MKIAGVLIVLLILVESGQAANHSGWSDVFSLTDTVGPITIEQSVLGSVEQPNFSVFPNPFNMAGNLTFTLTGIRESWLQNGVLRVYTISGALVSQLPLTRLRGSSLVWETPSNHEKKIGSGVYIARLLVGGQVIEKSFLLLK